MDRRLNDYFSASPLCNGVSHLPSRSPTPNINEKEAEEVTCQTGLV